MNTDTPRTDEQAWPETGLVEGDFARQLERELTAAHAEIERLDVSGIHSCHDNCQRWTCVLRRELKAVTEQRDELLRYNEEFRKEYDQAIEQRNEIDSMYHKIIKEVLECDPIPACQREDDQLEPPWEIIARIRKQRDRLAEAMTRIKTIYENPEKGCIPSSSDMYDEALQALTTNEL